MTVEGCGSESLQGDVRFAEVMGLMGATVEWAPYSITITGVGCMNMACCALGSGLHAGCKRVGKACYLRLVVAGAHLGLLQQL